MISYVRHGFEEVNANKCHILQVRTRNQKIDYEINGTKLESVQCVKGLGIMIASSLKFSKQCKDATDKANESWVL